MAPGTDRSPFVHPLGGDGQAPEGGPERARRMELLNQAAISLHAIEDPETLLEWILAIAEEALGFRSVAVLLVDPRRETLVVRKALHREGVEGLRIPVNQGLVGSVFRTGEPERVADLSRDPRYPAGGGRAGASEMAAPLVIGGAVIGVLDAEREGAGGFSQADLEIFALFATHTAAVIHRVRAHADRERQRRVEHQIIKATRALNATRNVASLLHVILKAAQEALGLESVALLTPDPGGQDLVLRSAAGYGPVLGSRIPFGEGVSGQVALTRTPALVQDVAASGAYRAGVAGGVTEMCVPLLAHGELLGVLDTESTQRDAFQAEDLELFSLFAEQAAMAIDNAQLFEDTQQSYYDTLKTLARAMEARDDYTRGHSERVAELALTLAQALRLPEEMTTAIFNAALLHDIGKMGVRDAVLLSTRPLTPEEREHLRRHPANGHKILGPLKFLGKVADFVRYHHERWDGQGYPTGIRGEEIPLASRIISVADTYDAMTSSRPYRTALSHAAAMAEIVRQRGTQFDPALVDAFVKLMAVGRS